MAYGYSLGFLNDVIVTYPLRTILSNMRAYDFQLSVYQKRSTW